MTLRTLLYEHHEHIAEVWFNALIRDPKSGYSQVPREELRGLLLQATEAFRSVLLDDEWSRLKQFISRIARKRFKEGFTVSQVQHAFELYRQLLLPLLAEKIDPPELSATLLRLHHCMVFTITSFSEFFQNIHENFLRSQAIFLEKEVARRTKELNESRHKYKTLVEEINDGYFVLVQENLVFLNRAFELMHGYQPGEMRGHNFLDFVARDSVASVRRAYEASWKGHRGPARLEYMRLNRDGRKLATEIMASISTFADQPAIIGICRDISKRVELEKKTRETEKLKALAQQAASLAHDVRNPLSAIKMNLQIFSQEEEDDTRRWLLDISLREIDHIEESLVEMMDLGIPYTLDRRPVLLRDFLLNCLDAMRQRMEHNQVEASVRLSRRLQHVNMDPLRMEQALVNVLFNAIEAQPAGGKLYLSSRLARDNGDAWAEIVVGDHGPGIPREIRPYIFDPLFSQKSMGKGLGLYNVKKILEAHGGRVIVKKRHPQGTNFVLLLPWEEQPRARKQQSQTISSPSWSP